MANKNPIKCTQYAVIEFHNCPPYVEKFVSDKEITIEDAVATLDDFNEDRDAITFVSFPTETRI